MKFVMIFVSILIFFSNPENIQACSCARGWENGFFTRKGSKTIPSNARGVLFTRYESDFSTPLKGDHFQIQDLMTKKIIPAQIVQMSSPLFFKENGWRFGIYRIEPTQKFSRDHKYKFSYNAPEKEPRESRLETLIVKIGKEPLLKESLEKITFKKADIAEIATFKSPAAGQCQTTSLGYVQEVEFGLPSEVKAYQDSVLLFSIYQESNGDKKIWNYEKDICVRHFIGRSEFSIGRDLVIAARDQDMLIPGKKYDISGMTVAFEIDDSAYFAPGFKFQSPETIK